jgi:hypothetical protein
MPSVQNPGRKGTGIPSEPDVNARHRLPATSSTCENAIVASTKYGPRSRLERYPMRRPMMVATSAPVTRPSHGDNPQRTPKIAAP